MLRLHDTASGVVRPLAQRHPGEVSMYVCGPTVYDVPHIGHGRAVLAYDVLRRYLTFLGLAVRHVSNITDIDDKVIARAADEGRSASEVALDYEARYWQSMDALGALRPERVPHATGYVEDMVAFIGQLVGAGFAYETSDGVYLSVDKVADYGLLAHQPLESLRAGARVERSEEKRSPLDFVVWKKAKPGEPTWPSPWGPGRPGWHTECVVMSLDLLGEGFDLHGGGLELIFPHHENERAQAVALGRDFAHHWIHHGWVTVEGEKMSKSLGNFTTVSDLLSHHDARTYRLLVLRSRYRSPIEITPETVRQAEEGLERLDALARRFELDDPLEGGPVVAPQGSLEGDGPVRTFVERMDDDLDTPAAMAGVFDLVRAANSAADRGDHEEGRTLAATVGLLCGALGLPLRAVAEDLDPAVAALVAERDEARAAKNFDVADGLRRKLQEQGWIVEDGPEGTLVHR